MGSRICQVLIKWGTDNATGLICRNFSPSRSTIGCENNYTDREIGRKLALAGFAALILAVELKKYCTTQFWCKGLCRLTNAT